MLQLLFDESNNRCNYYRQFTSITLGRFRKENYAYFNDKVYNSDLPTYYR